jgi:hypothetical protein
MRGDHPNAVKWRLCFSHPLGGQGKLDITHESAATVAIRGSWWVDDFAKCWAGRGASGTASRPDSRSSGPPCQKGFRRRLRERWPSCDHGVVLLRWDLLAPKAFADRAGGIEAAKRAIDLLALLS